VHDNPAELDEYSWPVCVTPRCNKRLWVAESDRWACRPCEDATAIRITELPSLFEKLNTSSMLMRGARKPGATTSGSRTPPIPPRLDVLALVAPGGGIAARLQAIEDSWRSALGWPIEPRTDGQRVFASWRINPVEAVKEHTRFLTNNLLWACSSYESVGQDIDDLRRLHGECTALANHEPRAGRVQIGACPTPVDNGWCGQPLTAATDNHRVHCRTCGARWDGLGEWRELRSAQEAVLAEASGAAA
jgi:hypothetical protein